MKTSSMLPLFAFLISLPLLAFSADGELVLDTNGNPLSTARKYQIMPALRGPGGGLKLAKTGTSKCPVTVLQHEDQKQQGESVQFTLKGVTPGIRSISTGAALQINFTNIERCATHSGLWLFGEIRQDDTVTQKYFAGIGEPRNNPDVVSTLYDGYFAINKSQCGYKLFFQQGNRSWDIGIQPFYGEPGKRLVIPVKKTYEISFISVDLPPKAAKLDGPDVLDDSKFDGDGPIAVSVSQFYGNFLRSVAK